MTGDRHLRPNAARRPNVGGILHRLFLFAALPFIVSGGADVIEEPVDALTDPGHGDDQPFFELADQRVPLGFEHGHFTLVFGKAADVFLGRPEPLLVGDAQVLVEFRHERNRLHAHLFEQVHGGGVPLKPFRKLVQTLGDLRQNLGGGFHLSGGGVEIDAHPAQGGPRLFAFPGIVVGCLGQTAHQALDNRDVLPDRARREAELPDFLRGQPGAQFRVLHAGAVFAETLRRLECGRRNGAKHRSAGSDRDAKGTKSRKHGRERALRPLERILHELADPVAERSDGFGLLPQCFFGFLRRLDRESFARGLLLHGDHLFVGSGDRVDGLRLAVVSLEKLVPLGDQPVHAALAVGLGLLFEGGDEPLDRGPGLIRNPDDLAVRRFRFLLEAVEGGVGLVRYRGDLVLGFENYAFRLVCHLRCLEHHEGTRLKCGEHGLAVARRYTPLRLAPVVEGGDLRSRHAAGQAGLSSRNPIAARFSFAVRTLRHRRVCPLQVQSRMGWRPRAAL